jgi:hypothetical protein
VGGGGGGGGGGRSGGGGGGGGQSSFPIKDDAGYIGYLTDSDSDNRVDALSRIVRDRRRVLLGSDCDFMMTFVVMVIVVLVVVMATLVVGSAIIKH